MALTKVSGGVLQQPIDVGIITATSIQVGSGTTIHDAGIDLGSGNLTSYNINSTGIITSVGGFVGDLTGDVVGNITGVAATFTDLTVNGNLTVQGTTTTLDTIITEVDKLEVGANNTTVGVAITQSGTGDALTIDDGSTRVLTVADGGNIGIGTQSPSHRLDVVTSQTSVAEFSGPANALVEFKGSGYVEAKIQCGAEAVFGSTNNYPTAFVTNSIEKVRITTDGNVGIGTDNPGFDFHLFRTGDTELVIESDRPNTDENANPKLIFRQDGGVNASAIGMNFDSDNVGNDLYIANSISSGAIRFLTGTVNGYTNAAERMRITSAGLVGIGTDNPGDKLHVSTVSYGGALIERTAAGGGVKIDLKNGNGNIRNIVNDSSGILQLQYNSSNQVVITQNGNVGIGTDNPSTKLTVYSSNSSTDEREIRIDASDAPAGANSLGLFRIIGDQSAAGKYLIGYNSTHTSQANELSLKNADGSITFHTANTEKLRITSSGNVGIGLTDPTEKLEVNGNIKANGQIEVAKNSSFYVPLTLADTGAGTNEKYWRFGLDRTSKSLIIGTQNDASNAAYAGISIDRIGANVENVIFYTLQNDERLRITSAGNVGVGTIAPSAPLDVAGQAIINDSGSVYFSVGLTVGNDVAVRSPDSNPTKIHLVSNTNYGVAEILGNGDNTAGYIAFATRNLGSTDERMRIDNAGNFGIGTTNPNYRLDASFGPSSLMKAGFDVDASSNPTLYLNRWLGVSADYKSAAVTCLFDGSITFSNATANTTPLASQSYSERMRIDSAGNVGIGTDNPTSKLDVSGNIVVSGTVDGRDLASDGTKLDGIESGATADQTAAEIRALVESATDSNVFTDADHTKLNGIESGATADQTASEILTAIKTVDGSGSGLDADTLDGIQASSFLRADTSDTSTAMLVCYTSLSNNEDYSNSPISIRERGLAGAGDGEDRDCPNLNFHWGSRASKSFWMGANGYMNWGEYNSSGVPQVDGTFRAGNLLVSSSSHQVWHAGNDGSGSGLDADTLDGIDSGSFLRSDAADVATGPISWTGTLATFDPGGSPGTDTATDVPLALERDHRLAGHYNGYIRTLLKWTSSDIEIGQGGTTLIGGINLLPGSSGVAKVNGNTIWHAGNDGSGSGLDADTVDGIQASSFLRSDVADTKVGVTTFSSDAYFGGQIYLTDTFGGYEQVEIAPNDIRVTDKHVHSEFGVWCRSTSFSDRSTGIEGVSDELALYSNSAERVRIDTAGNVGIGTDNPIMRLHVHGAANSTDSRIRLSSIEGSGLTIRAQSATENNINVDGGESLTFTVGNTEGFRMNSSGNIAFANGNGIDFSATSDGSGTATSELFDDYEEGTWTPSVFFGATAATVSSNGKYTKIGNLVHITYQVTINNLNGGSGIIAVGGLPYTPSQSPTYSHGNCQGNTNQTLPTGAGSIQPYIEHAVSTFRLLYMTNTGHADISQAHFPAGVTFYGDGDYYTA